MSEVTVLIPVGPAKIFREYLPKAIESVFKQTYPVDEILIVDDGAGITDQEMHNWFGPEFKFVRQHKNGKHIWKSYDLDISLWRAPTNIGMAQAFNCGVALASNELIVYLASDDWLGPDAIKDAVDTYNENNQKDAYYSFTYETPDGVCAIPTGAALINKNLWAYLNGYPPAAFAGPDAAVLSILMYWNSDRIIKIKEGKVNYYANFHAFQETKVTAQRFSAEMTTIRNILTRDFKPREGITLK